MNQKQYTKGYLQKIKDNGIFTGAVASTGISDRDGEILEPSGWKLDNFRKAPRILWSHMAHELPIGKATNIYVDGKDQSLKFDFELAEKENEFAKKIADLMRGGFINTFSVGYLPLKKSGDRLLENELLEISVVNVPANAEARLSAEYQIFQKSVKDINRKVEVGEETIRIPVKDNENFENIRTIVISDSEGIKALVGCPKGKFKDGRCSVETEIIIYLFDKDKWTLEKAREWVNEHKSFKENRMNIKGETFMAIKNCISLLKQTGDALEEVINKVETPKRELKVEAKKGGKNQKLLRALRQVDKATELAIKMIKNNG